MELFENMLRLSWQFFLSLSTFSKIFLIIFMVIVSFGIISKSLEEQKIRDAKLKALRREEKSGAEGEKEKEKIDDFLLKP